MLVADHVRTRQEALQEVLVDQGPGLTHGGPVVLRLLNRHLDIHRLEMHQLKLFLKMVAETTLTMSTTPLKLLLRDMIPRKHQHRHYLRTLLLPRLMEVVMIQHRHCRTRRSNPHRLLVARGPEVSQKRAVGVEAGVDQALGQDHHLGPRAAQDPKAVLDLKVVPNLRTDLSQGPSQVRDPDPDLILDQSPVQSRIQDPSRGRDQNHVLDPNPDPSPVQYQDHHPGADHDQVRGLVVTLRTRRNKW